MSTAWAGGSTREWRVLRDRILVRDGHLCQIRLSGEWTTWRGQVRRCLVKADCVHHVLGKDRTGNDPRYLKAACSPCNLKVGDPAKHDPAPQPRTQW